MDLVKRQFKNVQRQVEDGLAALLTVPVTSQTWLNQHRAPFVHPGTMMGPAETTLLRARGAGSVPVDAEWRDARAALAAATPLTYTPNTLSEVHVEWNDGPKIGHDELVERDGVQVGT
jgi:hypothetical protein